MDTQILQDIGLTNAEIKVYLALLELGSATAGPILEKTGLQNSVVHMTLKRLLEKGFISSIQEGKRHHYQPANPKHITEFIDEKRERFEQLLPELLAKQVVAKKKPEVTTFRGTKGIRELLYELLEAGGKEHHTFGSARESLVMGEAWWVQYHKKRSSKGIRAKLLFNESLRRWQAETKYKTAQVRYTEAGFEPITETIIRNDKVGIIIWTEKPLGVLFHNAALAQSYDEFFMKLWDAGKA